MNLYLGDYKLYKRDDNEQYALVQGIYLHRNYTGLKGNLDIRDYDVALLDLGNDTTRPDLNKFIRPICWPNGRKKMQQNYLIVYV